MLLPVIRGDYGRIVDALELFAADFAENLPTARRPGVLPVYKLAYACLVDIDFSEKLLDAIADALDSISLEDITGWIRHCG